MEKKSIALDTEELKAKYGTIYSITVTIAEDDDTVLEKSYCFKRPTAVSYDRFVKTANSSPTKASRQFCLDNIVDEFRESFMRDIEDYPALVMSINDKLFALLGLAKDATVKKQ